MNLIQQLAVMLVGIVLGQWQAAHAASFNCAKAASRVEKLICANHEVSLLDGELGDLYYYRMNRASASSAEKELIRSEQKKWLKSVRDVCKDVACLRAAYETRLGQLTVTDIHQDWETDGYWYFYAKRNPADRSAYRNTVLAYLNDDRSDVLLSIYRSVGIWVNKKRIATQEELTLNHDLFPTFPPATVCDQVKVRVEDEGTARYWNHLRAKVVIRDMQGKELKSFAIFRKFAPPKQQPGALDNVYPPGTLVVPLSSAVYGVAALNDCTFIATVGEGIIRFTTEGVTQAKLPDDMRIVYGDEIRRLNSAFRELLPQSAVMNEDEQSKIWFFYRNIFEGDQK